jgi:hypothetical protein
VKARASVDVTRKCPSPKVAFGILLATSLTVDETGNLLHLFLLVALVLFVDEKAA